MRLLQLVPNQVPKETPMTRVIYMPLIPLIRVVLLLIPKKFECLLPANPTTAYEIGL